MKALLQAFAKRLGIYERARASRLYNIYWSIFDPSVSRGPRAEMGFYRNVLSGLKPGDLVFDIGANQGHKAGVFLRLGAKLVAVNPDLLNVASMTRAYHRFRLRRPKLTIIGQAVSSSLGTATFWIDTPGGAKNTLSEKWVDTLRSDESKFGVKLGFTSKLTVATTTLDRLIEQYGLPFFIKIDVEGHEYATLLGLSRPVPFLSFEMNLPEFLDDGIRCLRRLNDLDAGGRFNLLADSDASVGLLMPAWLPCQEFIEQLSTSKCASVEVFWRSSLA